MKYGLWEDGKRIEWFVEHQVQQINNYQLDYGTFFNQSESDNMVDRGACFRKPANFDDRLIEVKRRIATLTIKAGAGPSGTP